MGNVIFHGRDNDELVDNLKMHAWISSKKVERVFRAVDRGDYVSPVDRNQAYKDISCKHGNIHLSAPCVYSKVIEGLSLKPGMSFLNIGSGTGYLSTIAGLILGDNGTNHGIEMHEDCLDYAYEHLERFKQEFLNVDVFEFCEPVFQLGNFLNAVPRRYDRVYCGAACPEMYKNFVKQFVKVGGILVMPYRDSLLRAKRTSETQWCIMTLLPVTFGSLMPPQGETDRCLIQLPLWQPHTLQELCRSVIRKRLRELVWSENKNLEEKHQLKTDDPDTGFPRRYVMARALERIRGERADEIFTNNRGSDSRDEQEVEESNSNSEMNSETEIESSASDRRQREENFTKETTDSKEMIAEEESPTTSARRRINEDEEKIESEEKEEVSGSKENAKKQDTVGSKEPEDVEMRDEEMEKMEEEKKKENKTKGESTKEESRPLDRCSGSSMKRKNEETVSNETLDEASDDRGTSLHTSDSNDDDEDDNEEEEDDEDEEDDDDENAIVKATAMGIRGIIEDSLIQRIFSNSPLDRNHGEGDSEGSTDDSKIDFDTTNLSDSSSSDDDSDVDEASRMTIGNFRAYPNFGIAEALGVRRLQSFGSRNVRQYRSEEIGRKKRILSLFEGKNDDENGLTKDTDCSDTSSDPGKTNNRVSRETRFGSNSTSDLWNNLDTSDSDSETHFDNNTVQKRKFVYKIRADFISYNMKNKIRQLPLAPSLLSYVNYNREL